VSTNRGQRVQRIGDAAIAILAGRGMRGLTHRAVDQAGGLPPGTTSNYARTRAALIELALARMTELESADIEPQIAGGIPSGIDGLAAVTADIILRSITKRREQMIARYELALEATRRPELRAVYDEAGRRFRDGAVAWLAEAGSTDPPRHARMLVAWAEGIMFDTIAGAGGTHTPTADELRASLSELLRTIVPQPDQESE
jgi:DNA-binding transcriptional regulator YbjK